MNCKEAVDKELKSNGLPSNIDIAVNLSGRNIGELSLSFLNNINYKSYLQEVEISRVKTSSLLSKLANEAKIPRYINASAVGFYKNSTSKIHDESSQYEKDGFMTELVRKWEETVIPLHSGKTFIMRTGVVLAKDSHVLENMYWQHKLGFGGPIASGRQWIPWIHIDDTIDIFFRTIIGSFDKMAETDKKTIINVVSPHCVRQLDFSKALSKALNAPISGKFPTPGFIFPILLGKERANLVLEGANVNPKFLLHEANYRFKFPDIQDALNNIYK
ncbi:hypothetical protein Ciccas_003005 [Cichlidogyrus casuarinus]|uniref:DUF1731 domain-containing protein n=1 Tax=Cichlidogyrus casuarinus TaxID=1844966 RepID=A0ABD2QG85_9PLAT